MAIASTLAPPQELLELGYGSAGTPLSGAGGLMTTGAVQPVPTDPLSSPKVATLGTGAPALGGSGLPAGTVTTGANPYASAAPAAAPVTTTVRSAGDSALNPFDDDDGPFMGGGDTAAADKNSDAYQRLYNYNRDLGPLYMQQIGDQINQNLSAAGQVGFYGSQAVGAQAAALGANALNDLRSQGLAAAANVGAQGAGWGNRADWVGQNAANALTAEGANAQAGALAGWQNAVADSGALRSAGTQSAQAGQQGATIANQYAQQAAAAGAAGAQAGAQGSANMLAAAGDMQRTGQLGMNVGAQGAQQIQQAAQGIGAAGQAGMAAGQQGAANATEQARQLQQAGLAGQRAISSAGQTAGQMGVNVASQGQQFLGQQGYQANLGESNAARNLAQQNAQQLANVEANQGPSAAQAQLRQGLNQAQSANLAMARSGRGFGGSASALSQAQNLNAQAGQTAANQSAMLRAQEDAAARQRQAQNYQAAAGVNLQAGQQALSREQMLAQQTLAQQQANQSAYLQAQGLGQQGLGQQVSAEQAAYQQLLAGQQAAGGQQLAGAQLGMQGAGMQLTAEQARAAAAAQAAQTGLAGTGQNLQAQQQAAAALGQGAQLGMQGTQQQLAAAQAAGQLGLAGNEQALAGLNQNQQALQSAGQLGLAGAGLYQQGAAANIGATQAGYQQALAGTLGGGQLATNAAVQGAQLGLAGTQAGVNAAMQGTQTNLGALGQATQLGIAAEAAKAANTQYSYGLTQQQIANALQIAGMSQGLEIQSAGMQNQTAGAMIGAVGTLGAGLMGLSDVNAKTDIVPLSTRSGPDPYGIDFAGASDAEKKKQDALRSKQTKPFMDAFSQFGAQMGGGYGGMPGGYGGIADLNINPMTGQPWSVSDVNAKTDIVPLGSGRQLPPQGQQGAETGYQPQGDYQQAGQAKQPEQTIKIQISPQGGGQTESSDAGSGNMAAAPAQSPPQTQIYSNQARQALAAPAAQPQSMQTAVRAPMQQVQSAQAQPAPAYQAAVNASPMSPFTMSAPIQRGMLFGSQPEAPKQPQTIPFPDAIGSFGMRQQAQPMAAYYGPGEGYEVSDERAKYGQVMSDERAKDEAGKMVSGLDPYAFRYKDPERHGQGIHYGIMAQDLERSPAGRTVVEQGADGLKRVNTPKLTMLNSAALAQYDDRLSDIEQRIANMGGPRNDNGKKKTRAA